MRWLRGARSGTMRGVQDAPVAGGDGNLRSALWRLLIGCTLVAASVAYFFVALLVVLAGVETEHDVGLLQHSPASPGFRRARNVRGGLVPLRRWVHVPAGTAARARVTAAMAPRRGPRAGNLRMCRVTMADPEGNGFSASPRTRRHSSARRRRTADLRVTGVLSRAVRQATGARSEQSGRGTLKFPMIHVATHAHR